MSLEVISAANLDQLRQDAQNPEVSEAWNAARQGVVDELMTRAEGQARSAAAALFVMQEMAGKGAGASARSQQQKEFDK